MDKSGQLLTEAQRKLTASATQASFIHSFIHSPPSLSYDRSIASSIAGSLQRAN